MLPLCMKLSPPHCDICENFLFVLHQQTFLLSFLFEENLPHCAKIGPGLRKKGPALYERSVWKCFPFLEKEKKEEIDERWPGCGISALASK